MIRHIDASICIDSNSPWTWGSELTGRGDPPAERGPPGPCDAIEAHNAIVASVCHMNPPGRIYEERLWTQKLINPTAPIAESNPPRPCHVIDPYHTVVEAVRYVNVSSPVNRDPRG